MQALGRGFDVRTNSSPLSDANSTAAFSTALPEFQH